MSEYITIEASISKINPTNMLLRLNENPPADLQNITKFKSKYFTSVMLHKQSVLSCPLEIGLYGTFKLKWIVKHQLYYLVSADIDEITL